MSIIGIIGACLLILIFWRAVAGLILLSLGALFIITIALVTGVLIA